MAWTTIAKRAIGDCIPKSWLDAFIDNMVYLYNALGGSGGSALNIVMNSSFENDVDADGIPDGWTRTLYTGGSGAIVSADSADAKYSYKFTHPGGGGNGGGYLTSDYVTWSPFRMLAVVANMRCTVTGTKVIVRVKFYDKDKAFISNIDVYTSTANPLLWTLIYAKNIDTPVTARFARLELHGGVNDTDAAGDVYFDFAQVVDSDPLAGLLPFTDSSIDQTETNNTEASYTDVGGNQSITIAAGTKLLIIVTEVKADGDTVAYCRWRIGTTYSSAGSTALETYVPFSLSLDVSALQGAQTLRMQLYRMGSNSAYGKSPSANAKYCKAGRIVSDGALGTQAFDAS
mgnify:CR=1 FL=1